MAEAERTRGKDMAASLSMPMLTRTWQMLLKGLGEARTAPMPLQAVEMTLVRLAYAADLPTPEDAVKALGSQGGSATATARPTQSALAPASSAQASAPMTPTTAATVSPSGAAAAMSEPVPDPIPEPVPEVAPDAPPAVTADASPPLASLADVVALCEVKRQATLAGQLTHTVHLVRFEHGRIEIRPKEGTPQDVAGKLGAFLKEETGDRWVVSISNETGEPTLHEQEIATASADPFVKSILESFPGATIERVRVIEEQD